MALNWTEHAVLFVSDGQGGIPRSDPDFLMASSNSVFTFFNWICVANRFEHNVCVELDMCFYNSLLKSNTLVCSV